MASPAPRGPWRASRHRIRRRTTSNRYLKPPRFRSSIPLNPLEDDDEGSERGGHRGLAGPHHRMGVSSRGGRRGFAGRQAAGRGRAGGQDRRSGALSSGPARQGSRRQGGQVRQAQSAGHPPHRCRRAGHRADRLGAREPRRAGCPRTHHGLQRAGNHRFHRIRGPQLAHGLQAGPARRDPTEDHAVHERRRGRDAYRGSARGG